MKIGFIGLGAMGAPMAECLLGSGNDMYVYDVSPAAAEKLKEKGATVCSSVLETAQIAEVLFLSLPNALIVESTLTSILYEKAAARYVVDLSSIPPASARHFAQMLAPMEIEYLDCPVSGGVGGAKKGALTIMAGGKPEALDALRPLLECIGNKIYAVGPVGSGSAIKMVNNYILACNMATAAEALALGERMGLSVADMREIISVSSGRSFITENKIPNFIEKRDFTPGFTVDLQFKDLGIARSAANEAAVPLMMGGAAEQLFQMARARGYGHEDISSVIKVCEEWLGDCAL